MWFDGVKVVLRVVVGFWMVLFGLVDGRFMKKSKFMLDYSCSDKFLSPVLGDISSLISEEGMWQL